MRDDGFDYEEALWGEEDVAPGAHTIAAFRLERALVHLPSRGHVAEVGCGAGRYLHAIESARPSLRLTGMDVSRKALELAAARAPGVDWRRIEGTASGLPAADGEFDAVLALDVLEHVPEPERLLAEVRRVLRPGGIFHLCVPCEGDALSLWRWLPRQAGSGGLKRRLAGHLWRFRRREILEALERVGFERLALDHSLHVLGNLADVGLFSAMALSQRFHAERAPRTSGAVLARTATPGARGFGPVLVRLTDRLLWWEARLLRHVPSWCLHVSARRGGGIP